MYKKTVITVLLALVMAPLGMEAKKKAKTIEVPQLINYPSAELSEYRLHGGNVVIQGGFVVPEEAKGAHGSIHRHRSYKFPEAFPS